MKPTSERLPRALVLRSYTELLPWVEGFVNGSFPLLFLIGRPGLGKSQAIASAMKGRSHAWLDCHATKLAAYCKLHKHRDEPVIIDDESTFTSDPGKLALMNALCQTNPVKTLRWDSTTRILEERRVPAEFTTTSPVVMITNRLVNMKPAVGAIIDRGQPLLFQPSTTAIHEESANWFTDREIHSFIGEWLRLIPGLSMRDYVKAASMKRAGLDWRSLLHRQWRTAKISTVVQLRANQTFSNEEERVLAFTKDGHGSRATYYRHVKKLIDLGVIQDTEAL